jgi:hypothetical protein
LPPKTHVAPSQRHFDVRDPPHDVWCLAGEPRGMRTPGAREGIQLVQAR